MRHLVLCALAPLVLASCSTSEKEATSTGPQRPADYLARAALASGEILKYVPGSLPTGTGGPAATLSLTGAPPSASNLSTELTASASGAAFTTVYLGVEGLPGHWEATVASRTTAALELAIGDPPPPAFTLRVALGDPDRVGDVATYPVNIGGASPGGPPPGPGGSAMSCSWPTLGGCFQGSGTISPSAAAAFQSTCSQTGGSYAPTTCNPVGVVGWCLQPASGSGLEERSYYYAPYWTVATAQYDCISSSGGTWH